MYGWWLITSALVRATGWPVAKVCSARAETATSPFLKARRCSAWNCHHICLLQGHPYWAVPHLCIPPPSGTQGSSGENPNEQSQHTVILECATSGGEEDCRATKRERLPLQLYSQTLMPNQAQTGSGWQETQNNCDLTLHQGLLWGSETDPCTAGRQGGLSPAEHSPQDACTPQRPSTIRPMQGGSVQHTVHVMDIPKFTSHKMARVSNIGWQSTVAPLRMVMWLYQLLKNILWLQATLWPSPKRK